MAHTAQPVNTTGLAGIDPGRLRDIRILAGYSLTRAARTAGCSPSHLCKVERGYRGASPELLGRLAAAYSTGGRRVRIADFRPARKAA